MDKLTETVNTFDKFANFYQEEFLRGPLSINGFEILVLERKAYPQVGKADTTDLFIYAKVV